MRSPGLFSAGVLLLLLGTASRTYAQQDKPDAGTSPKPEQQSEPGKNQQQVKGKRTGQPQEQAKPGVQQPQADTKTAMQPQGQAGARVPQQQGQSHAKPGSHQQQVAKPVPQQQQVTAQRVRQQQQGAKPVPQQQQVTAQRVRQQQQGAKPVPQQANRPSPQGQRVPQSEQQAAWNQDRANSSNSDQRSWQQRGGYTGYRIPQDRFGGSFGTEHQFRIYGCPMLIIDGIPRFQYGGYWFTMVDPWPEHWSDNWYQTDVVYIDYYNGGYYLYNVNHPGVSIAVNVFAS